MNFLTNVHLLNSKQYILFISITNGISHNYFTCILICILILTPIIFKHETDIQFNRFIENILMLATKSL